MTIYRAKTTFGSFRFEANLSEASAPIRSLPDSPDDEETAGFPTPYQTADARHSETEAARLLLDYFGSEYWLDPTVEVTETDDGETLYAGMLREDYVRSLLVSVDAEPETETDDPVERAKAALQDWDEDESQVADMFRAVYERDPDEDEDAVSLIYAAPLDAAEAARVLAVLA
jgi:hypothetical protein